MISLLTVLPLQIEAIIITMSYSAGIIAAITGLKDRTGSSSIAIKKTMQASMPKDKKWMNATFLAALKKMVADGVLIQNKGSYKLGAKAKKAPKKKATAPKKAAPKKKSAPKKKAAPKKKSAPKKKAVSLIIVYGSICILQIVCIHLTLFISSLTHSYSYF